jgi:hypothetical protein
MSASRIEGGSEESPEVQLLRRESLAEESVSLLVLVLLSCVRPLLLLVRVCAAERFACGRKRGTFGEEGWRDEVASVSWEMDGGGWNGRGIRWRVRVR